MCRLFQFDVVLGNVLYPRITYSRRTATDRYTCYFHSLQTRSKNQQLTLKAKDPLYQMAMGQRVGLSFLDAQLLNKVYCSGMCHTHH